MASCARRGGCCWVPAADAGMTLWREAGRGEERRRLGAFGQAGLPGVAWVGSCGWLLLGPRLRGDDGLGAAGSRLGTTGWRAGGIGGIWRLPGSEVGVASCAKRGGCRWVPAGDAGMTGGGRGEGRGERSETGRGVKRGVGRGRRGEGRGERSEIGRGRAATGRGSGGMRAGWRGVAGKRRGAWGVGRYVLLI